MPESCALIIDSLIEQRRSKGMTQKDLAKASCLMQSAIAHLESQKATPPANRQGLLTLCVRRVSLLSVALLVTDQISKNVCNWHRSRSQGV